MLLKFITIVVMAYIALMMVAFLIQIAIIYGIFEISVFMINKIDNFFKEN